jgi:hypothetical protein
LQSTSNGNYFLRVQREFTDTKKRIEMKAIKLSSKISYTIEITDNEVTLNADLKGSATTSEVSLFSTLFLGEVLKNLESELSSSPDTLIILAEIKEGIELLKLSTIENIKEDLIIQQGK